LILVPFQKKTFSVEFLLNFNNAKKKIIMKKYKIYTGCEAALLFIVTIFAKQVVKKRLPIIHQRSCQPMLETTASLTAVS
jgi:hypothetical protein